MTETKIIKAVFGAVKSIVTQPRYRYDYGQILEVSGITLPESFEARFSNAPTGESVRVLGQNQRVAVPDNLMRTGKSVWCYITVHDAVTDGRTMYTIRIPIKDATERTDAEPTPVQQDIISQAIATLNNAVERTSADVETTTQKAAEASASATASAQSASQSAQIKTDVEDLVDDAQASANASAQSASQSAQIKTDVEDLVDDAQASANASAQSASASANSASQAQGFAQSASASAQSASGYASQAQASANTASAKAQDASTSAQTASAKASEASQSASQALSYKTDAESAKTASQTAQGLAESARDSAVQAKTDVQNIADGIDTRLVDVENDVIKAFPTDTASGSIASFSDGADDLPLKSLIVDINPVQDLHGQDAPYPAGGGKNKLDISAIDIKKWQLVSNAFKTRSDSYSYITITVNPDDESVTVVTSGTYMGICIDIPSGAVARVFSQDGTAANTVYLYSAYEDGATILNNSAKSCSIPAETSGCAALLFYAAGTYTVKLQLEEGSTATSWSPYENLCPISGWTEVDVEQSGVNVWDEEWEVDTLNNTTGLPSPDPNNIRGKNFCSCKPNTGYYFYSGSNKILRYYWYDADYNHIGNDIVTNAVRTSPSNARYFKVRTTQSYGNTYNHDISINYPSTDHDYHPYTGRSITIQLGQTVYGGKLDVLSGELTVYPYYASYNGETLTGEWISDRDKYVSGTTPTIGAQVVNIGAQGVTVQLEPHEVESLYGVNNLWADSGDTEVVYRADTKLYIAKKIAEAISALS